MESKSKLTVSKLLNAELSGEKIFFLAYAMYIVAAFLINSTFLQFISVHWLNYVTYISIGFLVIKALFYDDLNKRDFLLKSFIITLTLLTWIVSKSSFAFMSSMFILESKNINFDSILNWYLKLGLILMLIIVSASAIGLIKNLTYIRGNNLRQSFGIIYPTDFAAHIFYLILSYCYLNIRKLNWIHYLIIFLISVVLYKFTQARLDVFLTILIIPIMWMTKLSYKLNIMKKLLSFFWIFIPVSVYLTFFSSLLFDYHNKIFTMFDSIFSGRLSISHDGIMEYGITLFGSGVKEVGWGGLRGAKSYASGLVGQKYFILDSSIIRTLLFYGLIFFVIIFVALTITSIKYTKLGNYKVPAVLLIVILSATVEQHLLDIVYNPFILLICASIFFDNKNFIGDKYEFRSQH